MEYECFRSIAESLKSVERPGFFATGGKCSLPLPSVSLSSAPDVVLGLPLGYFQVKSIVDSSTLAPFGRGEATIVDTTVRNTWQLSPSQFSINNPEWDDELQELVDTVKYDLGCGEEMDVACELYKLLLYEPGGFFKRHRDTEKSEGMFGTLVIQLPSNYEGGELLVYHGSKTEKFNFDRAAGCATLHYTAFYADCQHEIKPVTKGHRLCLVYNLVYRGSGDRPIPPSNQKIVSSVVSSMKEWSASADCPLMMTYLLEHKYCESSLSFRLLKNTDRAVADLLVQARKEVDFDLYVGQVILTKNWSAQCYGYRYGYGSYDTIELINEFAAGNHLVSPNGDIVSTISLEKECFVPDDFFDDIDPDKEEVEEATGNEGGTVDKQYNWTALMFWPTGNRITNIGVTNMIEQLARGLKTPSFVREKGTQLARDILSTIVHSSSLSSDSYKSLL